MMTAVTARKRGRNDDSSNGPEEMMTAVTARKRGRDDDSSNGPEERKR